MAQKLTETEETLIRTFLKTKAGEIFDIEYVFDTPVYFASAQDFFAKVNESGSFTKDYKCRFIMMSFATRLNSKGQGCDDNPSVFITYKMQVFRQTQEARDNKPNSHDLLVKDMIALQNHFLKDRDIQGDHIVHSALVQNGDMVQTEQCQYILEITGDWLNFRITVEIN